MASLRSRLDGEKPDEDEIRTKEDGQEDDDGKEVKKYDFFARITNSGLFYFHFFFG